MDTLLAKLSEQQVLLAKQKNALSSAEDKHNAQALETPISGSIPLTPATDSFQGTPNTEDEDADKNARLEADEMLRLKKELDAANSKIALQEQELSQTRLVTNDSIASMGPPVNTNVTTKSDNIARSVANPQSNLSVRPVARRQDTWNNQSSLADTQSDGPDHMSTGNFNRVQNIWSTSGATGFNFGLPTPVTQQFQQPAQVWGQGAARQWGNRPMVQALPSLMMPQQQQMQQRTFSGPSSPVSGGNGRFVNEHVHLQGGHGLRRSNTQNNRGGSVFTQPRGNWDSYNGNESPDAMGGMSPVSTYQPMGMFQAPISYQPRPIGTPLSPTAAEFTAGNGPWNAPVSSQR